MSRFFQQLIAREHGQVDTARPLVAPRFAQSVEANVEASWPVESAVETQQRSTPLATEIRDDAVAALNQPFLAHSSSREYDREQPTSASITTSRITSQWGSSHQLSSASNVDAANADTAARLAQISQWMGELTTVVNGYQSDRANVSASASTAELPIPDRAEQPQIEFLPDRNSSNLESSLKASTASSFQVSQSAIKATKAISSSNLATPRSQTTVADSTTRLPAAEQTVQPSSHRLQPVSAHFLQSISRPLPTPPPPAPSIQVSIGRVEIRATTPARPIPRPRKTRAPKPPALSLQQYLQRRSREG